MIARFSSDASINRLQGNVPIQILFNRPSPMPLTKTWFALLIASPPWQLPQTSSPEAIFECVLFPVVILPTKRHEQVTSSQQRPVSLFYDQTRSMGSSHAS
jgi:hypothetical protein